MRRAKVLLGSLVFLAGLDLAADPLLSRPETVGGRILLFPDHRSPNIFYYVPTGLALAQSFGNPQFFFYKYVYVKQGPTGETESLAGGVLTLSVEFKDEAETLRSLKGKGFEYRPVPIETMTCVLSFQRFEEEGKEASPEELARKDLLWTRKSFTLPLRRESATYLWKIFEEEKAAGLSVECEFSFSGFEFDDDGKLKEAERSGRLSHAVPVSMKAQPDLFKLVNLANKIGFNYRRLSVLCFDFVNGTAGEIAKITAEIEILTAKKQRDFQTVSFSPGSEPQQDLEFDIPEAKGGKYRYRVTKIYADGKSDKGAWTEGDDMFLDLSTYELAVKDKMSLDPSKGGLP